jgi:hypothetical protein
MILPELDQTRTSQIGAVSYWGPDAKPHPTGDPALPHLTEVPALPHLTGVPA